MIVPFLDLKAHHDPIKSEVMDVISKIIDCGAFAGGPYVEAFEKDFATYCQNRHAIGVGNGTEALWLTLLALNIGAGDEVITTPSTFIATAEAISFVGAKPVFVDIDETTYNLDPSRLEAAITSRTRAIMPVHLFGQMADMDPIMDIAARRSLPVIEDAAQAHGAEYKGRRAGNIGRAACFSFYPGKNLGAFGEAGAVVTDDTELDKKIRILRDHGQAQKYYHDLVGWNARMDGIQGAVLSIKLRRLEAGTNARRKHAARYRNLLNGMPEIVLPRETSVTRHVYHIYAVRVPHRDEVMERLKSKGVHCAIHYPVPLHLQKAYTDLGHAKGAFPVAERCAREFVSLPMFPELTEEQIDHVASSLKEAISRKGKRGQESEAELSNASFA